MNSTREELLFALALTKTVAERSVWLDRECDGDPALRARLDALLAAHEQPEDALATATRAVKGTIKLDLLSRRRLLRRVLCSAAGLPLLGASAFLPGQLLAATEESPETENNWEGPFYKPGAPVRSVLLEKGMAGTPLTVTGRILDTQGRPLKGAPPR